MSGRREVISLPAILVGRNDLQVPFDVQSAHYATHQGNDVVDVMRNTAGSRQQSRRLIDRSNRFSIRPFWSGVKFRGVPTHLSTGLRPRMFTTPFPQSLAYIVHIVRIALSRLHAQLLNVSRIVLSAATSLFRAPRNLKFVVSRLTLQANLFSVLIVREEICRGVTRGVSSSTLRRVPRSVLGWVGDTVSLATRGDRRLMLVIVALGPGAIASADAFFVGDHLLSLGSSALFTVLSGALCFSWTRAALSSQSTFATECDGVRVLSSHRSIITQSATVLS